MQREYFTKKSKEKPWKFNPTKPTCRDFLKGGKEVVEKAFGRKFSNKFHIHRTRVGFPNEGIDTFEAMAKKGLWIVDRVVQEELKGGVDLNTNSWYIPKK